MAQEQRVNYEAPKVGTVTHIQNQAHLQKIIKEYPGVVVDFWSANSQGCMRFKPIFEGTAQGNQNKNIVFCAVDCDNARDVA